jgi:nucleoside-diphosphate-sugar epimerase
MSAESKPSKEVNFRFLVTGGRGVLGKRIVVLLSSNPNYEVVSLPGDIRDREYIGNFFQSNDQFTHLIHAAAIVPTDTVQNDLESAYRVNVLGTWVVIEEFLKQNSEGHVTYISSSHVYKPSNRKISESSDLGPMGSYGRTKLAGEFVANDLSGGNYKQLCVARLFSLYSNDQVGSFLLPSLKRKISNSGENSEIEILGWNNVRDFASADFYAKAVVHLVTNSLVGVYNVGTGKGKSVLDFAKEHIDFKLKSPKLTRQRPATKIVADVKKIRSSGFDHE